MKLLEILEKQTIGDVNIHLLNEKQPRGDERREI